MDMSEYMEKHSVARLIGAPPGYVGYDEGGALTEAVRRRPYQVILFDEIEKAHPDVFNVLLQVLDDGRLTDGQGRTVDFRNTLIVMTSNLGSEYLAALNDDQDADAAREDVMNVVRASFRPEFLNRDRRDHPVPPLAQVGNGRDRRYPAQAAGQAARRSQDRSGRLTSEARIWLADKGYDPAYGARPLKRVVQKYVQDPLAEKILLGEVGEGAHVSVSAGSDRLVFSVCERETCIEAEAPQVEKLTKTCRTRMTRRRILGSAFLLVRRSLPGHP
jgi:ATP-dependent Clp protease ATP-binding subunit ClpB